ncbi:uncharacterized protein [Rutidosis leptorrhynchoides]|uniref:uncharacterized protein n=1 Tax=Rutidosis leptorrhynchoides TaxID=125765 RepID=UPI003A99E783
MRAHGDNISDKRIVEKILISMTEKYDHIITAIEESKDIETLSSKLKLRSQKSNKEGKRNFEEYSRGGEKPRTGFDQRRKSYPSCGICKKTNHLEKGCFHIGKSQCNNCKRFGHLEKDCRLKRNHRANYTEENEDITENNNQLFYACHDANELRDDAWFIDSGCCNHMTGDEKLFQSINTSMKSRVKLGNGALVDTKGKGTITVQTNNVTLSVNDVLLIPSLANEITDTCESCMMGKQHRKPFPRNKAWRAKGILELVHTDVCGPMRTPSLNQNKYFSLFIGDYSRMTWFTSCVKNQKYLRYSRSSRTS